MLSISRCFALMAVCLHFSPSRAIPTEPHVVIESRQFLDLRGIDFSQAASECTSIQLTRLREAFSELQYFTYATNPFSPAEGDDPAFLQFFGDGYLGSSGKYFYRIFDNLARAGAWPSQGNGNGSPSSKIQVHCADITQQRRCLGNTLAYTGDIISLGATAMVFCPMFFSKNFPHASARAQVRPTRSLNDLITQEHIILHELMHADNLVFSSSNPKIIDRQLQEAVCYDSDICTVIKRTAYGPYYASQLAEKDSPTFPATTNADNYAWFATRKYFERAWKISVDDVGRSGSVPYIDIDLNSPPAPAE